MPVDRSRISALELVTQDAKSPPAALQRGPVLRLAELNARKLPINAACSQDHGFYDVARYASVAHFNASPTCL